MSERALCLASLRMKTAPLLLLCLHHCEVRSANDTAAAASMAANTAADEDDDGEKRRSLRLKNRPDYAGWNIG